LHKVLTLKSRQRFVDRGVADTKPFCQINRASFAFLGNQISDQLDIILSDFHLPRLAHAVKPCCLPGWVPQPGTISR
jgi:hypothetical protein